MSHSKSMSTAPVQDSGMAKKPARSTKAVDTQDHWLAERVCSWNLMPGLSDHALYAQRAAMKAMDHWLSYLDFDCEDTQSCS